MRSTTVLLLSLSALAACGNAGSSDAAAGGGSHSFSVQAVAQLSVPWAMSFLPDGRLLVTEQSGTLRLITQDGQVSAPVAGVPEVAYAGQGGLGDVVLHPQHADNRLIYLSYAEPGEGDTRGAALARARLELRGETARLEDLEVIWRQQPKVSGNGHYSHRIAFDAEGLLWLTSGERQKMQPAQDLSNNLGAVLRLNADGTPAAGNPYADRGGVSAQIWSYGHRNLLGIAFDADGRLWTHEMGPRGGDELNLIVRGDNYGWPVVSNGRHYDGRAIPDHDTRPEFNAPELSWTPVISPAGFIIYSGDRFPNWRGDGFIGGLSSRSLLRIEFDGERAREAQRWHMGQRIREVEQGPDGAIWLLEDEDAGEGGRLLKLVPAD